MNVITSQTTYATFENAVKKLDKETDGKKDLLRWMIAVTPDGKRFVPVVIGAEHCSLAHHGIMIVS